MKELHLIEGRNTGFPTALKALSDNGSDKFRIDMDPDRQYLSVIIPVHNSFLPKKKSDDEFINRILEILCNSAMTVTEIARALGYIYAAKNPHACVWDDSSFFILTNNL